MDLGAAQTMATRLMAEHGLTGWRLVWDGARTRAGVCRSHRREIGLSRVLTALHPEEEVRDTVLHEVAHALVGPRHHHDAVWRATALAIGCSGRRCSAVEAPRDQAPWQGRCPQGHVVGRFRRPVRPQSCRRCSRVFDPAALLVWRRDGREVPMGEAYEREVRQLLSRAEGPGGSAPVEPRRALRVGEVAAVLGPGRWGGVVGRVRAVGRSRYHLETDGGTLTVPFALARPAGPTEHA